MNAVDRSSLGSEPPTLEVTVELLAESTAAMTRNPTVKSSEAVCQATRSALAAYFDRWLENRRLCFATFGKKLEQLLETSVQITLALRSDASLTPVRAKRTKAYADSIASRLEIVRVLHRDGADAALQVMHSREKRLDAT